MRKKLFLIFLFLGSYLIAEDSIEITFQKWLEYRYSAGNIGIPSKVFDRTIKLVAKGRVFEAKERLQICFPLEDLFIEEIIQLFANANNDLSSRDFSWKIGIPASFSFTDYLIEKREKDESGPPHKPEEILFHVSEEVLAGLAAGECIVFRSPICAVIAAIDSVHSFLEAGHKYCDNIRWEMDQEPQNFYDRITDSEVR